VRLPRNAAYCAAWNSGFLTTFRWSSGSRNARGEMAHSDALYIGLPAISKKGQSRRSGCAPMTSGRHRQEDKFRARRASHLCHQETYAPQQLAARSITSSARASSGADRETKRLCRLQIGCQPGASRKFDRQVAQCSAPLLTTAPPRHSGQGSWRQDCPRRRCSDRAGPRRPVR
jgi:hypothetical protein